MDDLNQFTGLQGYVYMVYIEFMATLQGLHVVYAHVNIDHAVRLQGLHGLFPTLRIA